MHKIQEKEFTLEDFSTEHLLPCNTMKGDYCYIKLDDDYFVSPLNFMEKTIEVLNYCRKQYLQSNNKWYWWQMIQLLPSSYNQTRNVMMNYEVLANIYKSRRNHKLDEWRVHKTPEEHEFRNKDFSSGKWGFCDWIESLPYSELITGKK